MNAGILRDNIEIWRRTETKNCFGEKAYEYAPIRKIRANVEHGLGGRSVKNDEIWHNYSKTFKVRLHTDVRDEDRIKYQNHFYVVQSIDIDVPFQQILIQTELINES